MEYNSLSDFIAIVDDGLKLIVSIKPPRRRDIIAFLSVWFAVWALMGVLSFKPLVLSGNYPWFTSLIWFPILIAILAFTGLTLLYYLAGRDVIIAEPGRITLREEFRGLGISRRYNVKDIELLELEDRETLSARGLSEAEIDGNSLWFSSKGKIFPVGSGMKLEQAERLRREIISRATRTMGAGNGQPRQRDREISD